ncbi:MAG: excinuclease ABC subunit UvrA [bacterium]|nr:excinuclease ABC subunit UvrA [bacterium]
MEQKLIVKGARQHNLKNIDLEIPKNKLVVFTGISGSGKSSLAFETIYAEGQRRYVESLSTYARQFLGIMNKPDVDTIEGLSPAISIEQKTTSHNPRSTVGTVTEIYDYLRLLFARVGHPHCPICGREIAQTTSDQITDSALELIKKNAKANKVARVLILSPIVRDRKGEFSNMFTSLRSQGYTRVRIDGKIYGLEENFVLIKTNKHSIDVLIDRISIENTQLKNDVSLANLRSRIHNSIEQALKISEGLAVVSEIKDEGFIMPDKPTKFDDHLYSEKFSCPVDNISLPEIEPRTFSFNSPHGACPGCKGLGVIQRIDPERVINPNLTISEGGILPLASAFENETWYSRLVATVALENGFDERTRLGDLEKEKLDVLLNGTGKGTYEVFGKNRFGQKTRIEETFGGIVAELQRRHTETESDYVRQEIEKYMHQEVCPDCNGARLTQEALSITIDGKSIDDFTKFSIDKALEFTQYLQSAKSPFSNREQEIGKLILKEISARLNFLVSVGLEYITLNRAAGTLAGGEAQRIRLASQIGSGLTGVLYVLDEPTIGLHQRDNRRLISTLKQLRDLGNTVIVVEHDRETVGTADEIVDFGPGAGKHGGAVVAQGNLQDIIADKDSLTGKYMSGKKDLWVNPNPRTKETKKLLLTGALSNNLKNVKLHLPLHKFVCITGVSGSGKSTLIVDTLYPALKQAIEGLANWERTKEGNYEEINGTEDLKRVLLIDQSPIGRTPRSNAVTYTGIFTSIREIMSQSPDARVKGYGPGRFSFNVRGGRCEACEGQGVNKIEMQFLSDVYVTCEVCNGSRFNRETLDVEWHNKNVADILKMTVEEAKEFFQNIPLIADKLETLMSVGLSYMELGQPAPTLSGGEAQRVKLSAELGKHSFGQTVYILDEPTTGLHFADIEKLVLVLNKLVDKGNTVIVIEHNLDVIKNADYLIDLGPEGGDKGGEIIAEGTPREVSKIKSSYTGQFLAEIL